MAYRVSYRGNDGFKLGPIGYLIVINLVMLIVTSIRPDLRFDLGLAPAALMDRPWTIITNMFVHAGIWHFFTNMITLYFFGNYLLRLTGSRNFLLIYFIAGLAGNLMYLWLGNPYTVAIGASGAIFGVAGALVVLRPKLRVFIIPIPVPIPLWIAVLGGFVLMSFSGGVAWQAHLGGLVVGAIAGYYFKRRTRGSFFSL